MARILVIFSASPADGAANAAAANASANAIDRHNRPRARGDIILLSLEARYPHTASFVATSPSPSCNLIDLYRPVHDPSMVRFLVEAWSKWSAMGLLWDKDNCHHEWRGEAIVGAPLWCRSTRILPWVQHQAALHKCHGRHQVLLH